ncbi:MAG TPA: DUF5132 domain-containing protein [Methylobacter sp.]|jgi:uncharacterized membrane protein YgaE (UPF0421/DUF939 family)
MAKIDDFIKGSTPFGIAIGIGATVFAAAVIPILPALAKAARPTVRAAIKSGIVLSGKAQELIAETTEHLEDVFAEVNDELQRESENNEEAELAEYREHSAHREDV